MVYHFPNSIVFTGLKHGSSQIQRILEDMGHTKEYIDDLHTTKFDSKEISLRIHNNRWTPIFFLYRHPRLTANSALLTDLFYYFEQYYDNVCAHYQSVTDFVAFANKPEYRNDVNGLLSKKIWMDYPHSKKVIKDILNFAMQDRWCTWGHLNATHLFNMSHRLGELNRRWRNIVWNNILILDLDNYNKRDSGLFVKYNVFHKATYDTLNSKKDNHTNKKLINLFDNFFEYAGQVLPEYRLRLQVELISDKYLKENFSDRFYTRVKFDKIIGDFSKTK